MLNVKPSLFAANVALFFLVACQSNSRELANQKHQPGDPFAESMVESQFFDIDPKVDNVLEGEGGTMVVVPKGSLLDADGNVVSENVKLELAEALSMDQMLLSNLSTTSNNNLLETGGMIFIQATANGEPLSVSKTKPLYFEIPTKEKKAGMMAYKGVRSAEGEMNWVDPKPLENYLVPVDLDLLDFLPEGFEAKVKAGMPFRGHQTANKALVDSLYYGLKPYMSYYYNENTQSEAFGVIDINSEQNNEPYYNKQLEVVNGEYGLKGDLAYDSVIIDYVAADNEAADSAAACGILPASIKTIKSDEFQNTFIATREFETRIQSIFRTTNQSILELYVNNLKRNLSEVDSMAAALLSDNLLKQEFENYAGQDLGNVKDLKPAVALLKDFYEQRLAEVQAELQSLEEQYQSQLKLKADEATQKRKEYKDLLFKRERYRMESYGFEWSDLGWVNIDVPARVSSKCKSKSLNIIVRKAQEFDRVHSYVVFTSIRSLYRLNSKDQENFYVGNSSNKTMLMPCADSALSIVVAYKGQDMFLGKAGFLTNEEPTLQIDLELTSKVDFKKFMSQYDNYRTENSIAKDLEYLAFFAKENERLKKLQEERVFMHDLWSVAFKYCTQATYSEG